MRIISHYLRVAFRSATARKTYSIINISGLAVGMACCILILVFILTEVGYDRYHDNADDIYRLGANLTLGGTPNAIASTNATPALAMVEEFPEVIGAARVRPMGKRPVRYEDRHFYEERILWADASIFEIFSFPMVRGNPASALETAYTMVITEEMAEKYFGDRDPLGETLVIGEDEYTINGVVRNVRSDSHFVFDMLCSMETLYDRNRELMESWASPFIHYSYLLLHETADYRALEKKFPEMIDKYMGEGLAAAGAKLEYFLQPLTRIHLHSDLRHELAANSDISYVYTFGTVALSILLIACFNFMNLATARSSTRSKEIGVRKVLGADRRELIRQFLAESLLYSLASLIVAIVLVHLALPFLGDLLAADSVARAEGIASMSERILTIDYIAMPWLIPAFVGLALVVGLVAGSYPAFFLASFDPSRTLKGGWVSARGNAYFRRVLVALQFAISVALIVATVVVVRQLGHMREIRLGFDKDHVVVVPIMGMEERASIPSIREELLRLGNVESVAASSHAPGGRPSGGSYVPEGYPEGEAEMMDRMTIDENFVEMMGMEIAQGRGFSPDFPADETESILINEAAAKKFGWDDPIGKKIRFAGAETGKTVVGVVRDFHFSSPHRRIGPIYIDTQPPRYRSVFVRIAPADIAGTLELLRTKWDDLGTDRPFEYYFLDAAYDRQFLAERNLGTLFAIFSGLAVFIASLGLFGIASFTVERRTKEIGIRKVLGSSVAGLVFLLSRELIVLGLVASLIAWPVAWILMNRWLEEFPLRTEMGPWIFIVASGMMLAIGFATVSIQSIRAGLADPAETLRCE
jgi:putative ABC transport system permease protein